MPLPSLEKLFTCFSFSGEADEKRGNTDPEVSLFGCQPLHDLHVHHYIMHSITLLQVAESRKIIP
jgi:hypothetical protein